MFISIGTNVDKGFVDKLSIEDVGQSDERASLDGILKLPSHSHRYPFIGVLSENSR